MFQEDMNKEIPTLATCITTNYVQQQLIGSVDISSFSIISTSTTIGSFTREFTSTHRRGSKRNEKLCFIPPRDVVIIRIGVEHSKTTFQEGLQVLYNYCITCYLGSKTVEEILCVPYRYV